MINSCFVWVRSVISWKCLQQYFLCHLKVTWILLCIYCNIIYCVMYTVSLWFLSPTPFTFKVPSILSLAISDTYTRVFSIWISLQFETTFNFKTLFFWLNDYWYNIKGILYRLVHKHVNFNTNIALRSQLGEIIP